MEFTNEEKHRIDVLYGTDFKDVQPADIELIQRWEQQKALAQAEYQAKIDAIAEESAAKVSEAHKTAEKARKNLNELKNAALKRLEIIENGQKE